MTPIVGRVSPSPSRNPSVKIFQSRSGALIVPSEMEDGVYKIVFIEMRDTDL